MSDCVPTIAGAIADAVRESLHHTLTPQPQVMPGLLITGPSSDSASSSSWRQPDNSATTVGTGSLYQCVFPPSPPKSAPLEGLQERECKSLNGG